MYISRVVRRAIPFLLACILSFTLSAQQSRTDEGLVRANFEELAAFDYTIKALATEVAAGNTDSIPKDRYMILDGIVSSRQLVSPAENDYVGILELSSGEWEGGEDLYMYRCYVQLIGPDFFGTVPEPRSRTASPDEIPLHAHILLVGTYLGYGEDQQGNRFPVLEAVDFRILE